MATKKRAARKSARTTEDPAVTKAKKEHTPETRPSDSGARQPDPRSPATRRTDAAPGTEIETSSGPQEVGPTRGARRPYTETIPGAPSRRPVIVVPTEEDEKLAERRKREIARREAADKALAEGTPVKVIALKMGFYNEKRQAAGSQFVMRVPKGQDVKTYASWVEPVEEYQERIESAATETAAVEPARRGARKTGAGRKSAASAPAADGEKEPASEPAGSSDKDVL